MCVYKKIEVNEPFDFSYIERTNDDGIISFIPCDEANSDYQAYLNKDNPDWGKGTIS